MSSHSFGFYWSAFFGLIVARYFLIAGSIYGVLYLVMAHRVAAYSLRRSPPQQSLIRQNITLSLISASIFALGAAIVMIAYDQGLTQIYVDSHPYGAWYSIVSLLLVLILQDTYFYFLHRAFHHPRL
ncbi:MAG: sterol desaturase family protein, partial [Sphaerospermopsis kisseleviana]